MESLEAAWKKSYSYIAINFVIIISVNVGKAGATVVLELEWYSCGIFAVWFEFRFDCKPVSVKLAEKIGIANATV